MTNLLILFYSVYMQNISVNRYNLDNLEAGFRKYLIVQQVSIITLKNYLSDLRHFFGWLVFYNSSMRKQTISENLDERSVIALIDTESIGQYKTYIETNKLPHKTINRRLSTLRKFCTFCISQGWMQENPAKKVINISAKHTIQDQKTDDIGQHPISNEQPLYKRKVVPTVHKTFTTDLDGFRQDMVDKNMSLHDINLIMEDLQDFFTVISSK